MPEMILATISPGRLGANRKISALTTLSSSAGTNTHLRPTPSDR